ncbi:MAG: lipid A biosynthesis acyltransferase [Lutibacter sp.]|nr:MAG: lipid A biosynthesis acyltransferase [Lutibacter sp.]
MQLLIYILVYPIIWLISILPFRILYMLSDVIAFLLYYIIGYRKKVVYGNLKLAFPKKSAKELKSIRRKFYRHFTDIFMEMIKSFTISKTSLKKHYSYTNIDLLDQIYKDGKSVILIGSHYANWEWIVGLNSFMKYKGYAGYTKVSNPYFNAKILKSRQKFGAEFFQTSKVISEINNNQKNKIQGMYGLLSDQSPMLEKTHYWSEFLGVKVPIHTGAEMLAKKYDLNIILVSTKKLKRGYYESSFTLITDDAKKYPDYELTDIFLRKVEEQIRETPQYYFWTHNRFKHKDKYQEYLKMKSK